MKYEIRNICPASLGKIFAAIYFIAGLITSVFSLLIPQQEKNGNLHIDGPIYFWTANGNSTLWIILYPFLAALLAMIAGFIVAWIYNGISKKIGGIEITLNEKENGA